MKKSGKKNSTKGRVYNCPPVNRFSRTIGSPGVRVDRRAPYSAMFRNKGR